MSSDNAVIILHTLGDEYRVAHVMGPDNYLLDDKGKETSDPDIQIKNARDIWSGSKVFRVKEDAWIEAHRIYDEFGWTEYGLLEVNIDRKF